MYQIANSAIYQYCVIGGLYLRYSSFDVSELRPAIASAIVSAAFVLPLLGTLLPISDVLFAAVLLLVVFMMIPLNETIGRRLGFSVGASISILALAIASPNPSGPNLWALALPSALVFVRPFVGGVVLTIVIVIAVLSGNGLHIVVPHVIAALAVSGIVFVLTDSTVSYLYRPIVSYAATITKLVILYLLGFVIITLWFAFIFSVIQRTSPGAFKLSANVEISFLDLFIYAGIINASGEPVYLDPISMPARAATLIEMIVSYGFSTIYLAVVISKLLDRNSAKTKGVKQ